MLRAWGWGVNRREFLVGVGAAAAVVGLPAVAEAAEAIAPIASCPSKWRFKVTYVTENMDGSYSIGGETYEAAGSIDFEFKGLKYSLPLARTVEFTTNKSDVGIFEIGDEMVVVLS